MGKADLGQGEPRSRRVCLSASRGPVLLARALADLVDAGLGLARAGLSRQRLIAGALRGGRSDCALRQKALRAGGARARQLALGLGRLSPRLGLPNLLGGGAV